MNLAVIDSSASYCRMFRLFDVTKYPKDKVVEFHNLSEVEANLEEFKGLDAVIIGRDIPDPLNAEHLAEEIKEVCGCAVIGLTLFPGRSYGDCTFMKGEEERVIELIHDIKEAA